MKKSYYVGTKNISGKIDKCYYKGCEEKDVTQYHNYMGGKVWSCFFHKPIGWPVVISRERNEEITRMFGLK